MGGNCPKLSRPSGAEVYIGLHVGLAEEDSMRGGYRCGGVEGLAEDLVGAPG